MRRGPTTLAGVPTDPQVSSGLVHDGVLRWARDTPQAVALRQGEKAWTYADLARAAHVWQECLTAYGASPGHVVPVLVPRTVALPAVLLGVLLTGAAYAVVDAQAPAEQVAAVLRQLPSPVRVEVGRGGEPVAVASTVSTVARIPVAAVGDQRPCSVFFTSGSTAAPKGVLVPHAGTTLLFQSPTFARLDTSTVTLQAAPLYWDGLTLELWSALLNGGTCVLLPQDSRFGPERLREAVAQGVNLLWLTSSLFNLVVEESPSSFSGLRQVTVGGERLSPKHLRRFLERHPDIRLVNGYGPAEATVFVSTHRIGPDDLAQPTGPPIGVAAPHTRLVLDGVPDEADGTGELLVLGPRVGLGYLEPTLPTGLRTFEQDSEGGRVHRTGDVVRRQAGLLHFLHRVDREVKVRGRRVDPAELESLLEEVPGVERARAVPVLEGVEVIGLAAFVQARVPEAALSHCWSRVDTLPSHLRPVLIEHVARWPYTNTGKMDDRQLLAQSALPRPHGATHQGTGPGARASLGSDPLVLLLGEVAAVVGRRVAPEDTLHGLRVSSLQALRLAIRLERTCGHAVELGPRERQLTLRHLASQAQPGAGGTPPGAPDGGEARVTVDPVRAAFLLQSEVRPEDTSVCCTLRWDVDAVVEQRVLQRALEQLCHTHEALSSTYSLWPEPRRSLLHEPVVRVVPLSGEQRPDDARAVGQLLQTPLDVESGEVLRAAWWSDGTTSSTIVLAVHHVAFDGWSEALLARDLAQAVSQARQGRPLSLGPRRPAPDAQLVQDPSALQYWLSVLDGATDLSLTAPGVAGACSTPGTCQGHQLVAPLPGGALEALGDVAHHDGRSLLSELLAVWARVLLPRVGNEVLAVGVPVARPRRAAAIDAIGCCINTVCVCLRRDEHELSQRDRARQLAQRLEGARRGAHVAFPDVVSALGTPRTGRSPVYQHMFALQDNEEARLDWAGVAEDFSRPAVMAPVELLVEVWPRTTGAEVTVNHQCDRVDGDEALHLRDQYVAAIAAAAGNQKELL